MQNSGASVEVTSYAGRCLALLSGGGEGGGKLTERGEETPDSLREQECRKIIKVKT